jgi:hypothetical protein
MTIIVAPKLTLTEKWQKILPFAPAFFMAGVFRPETKTQPAFAVAQTCSCLRRWQRLLERIITNERAPSVAGPGESFRCRRLSELHQKILP